jgi:iron complex outermembrane receptor protein
MQMDRCGRAPWRVLKLSSASVIAVASGALLCTQAVAQTAPTSAVEEVVVTGSRIVRDGYSAPTPTTVIGAQEIQASAPANLADYVNKLPQLGASTNPRTAGAGVGGGTGGANFLNTRSLGANRTLVLLDGRRVVGSATTGSVDINLLPTALVQRVDVVTGGASAAYGSDAVAGVVNFVLDKTFTGFKGNVQGGLSTHGDGGTFNAEMTYGTPFAGGRGHFLLSGQYALVDDISRADSRDWYQGYKIIVNPAYTATNGQPGNLLLPNVGLARATDGGLIFSGPLKGTMFGPGGALQTFTFGNIQNGLIQSGGTPNDIGGRFQLLPPLEQKSFFSRLSYDITDNLNANLETSYGYSDTTTDSSPYVRHGDITINTDNPYIPAALNTAGMTSFLLGRTNYDLGIPGAHNQRELKRVVVGLDGKFLKTGKWSAYYQAGKTSILNEVVRNPIVANYNRAVDVVRNPAVGGVAGVAAGDPVCRSTLTSPTNGCQPLNVFGLGSPSLAAINYVNGVAKQNIDIRQDVAALNGQIEPFSLWAGPVSLAAGVEYRKEQYTADADPLSVNNGYWLGNYKAGAGEYSVKEAFAEVIVPLLRDAPLAKAVDFNGAVRITDYSTSGTVKTWKAGLTWDVNDDLRLRGTLSRDIRAPNLNDLFLGGQSNSIGVTDVLQSGTPQVFITQITGGNPTLVPERADTTAYGVVYRPSWFPGFSGSIDYYNIEIDNAITGQTAQTIINSCYGFGVPATPSVCSAINLARAGTLAGATVRVGGVNVQSLETSGLDMEASYRRPLDAFVTNWKGDLDLRLVGANVRKYRSTLGGVVTDNLNTLGNALEWRWFGTAAYSLGPSRTTLTVRYVGPAVYNNFAPGTAQSVDHNHIASVTYFDLATNYSLELMGTKSQFYAVVENLFDKDPPVVGGSGGNNYASYGASATYHDTIGRTVRVGLRFQY